MAGKKKTIPEEDVLAMKHFWAGVKQPKEVAVVQDTDIFHNPHRQTPCPCQEFRLARGVKYCRKCWPLPGDTPKWDHAAATDRILAAQGGAK